MDGFPETPTIASTHTSAAEMCLWARLVIFPHVSRLQAATVPIPEQETDNGPQIASTPKKSGQC